MIKKDYFPTQEVPEWVKDRVMQHVKGWPKKLRLLSMIRLRIFVPVTVFLFVAIGGFMYRRNGGWTVITMLTSSGYQDTTSWTNITETSNGIYTQNTTTQTTAVWITESTDDLLQQKLAEAEIVLNDLSAYANKEENITL